MHHCYLVNSSLVLRRYEICFASLTLRVSIPDSRRGKRARVVALAQLPPRKCTLLQGLSYIELLGRYIISSENDDQGAFHQDDILNSDIGSLPSPPLDRTLARPIISTALQNMKMKGSRSNWIDRAIQLVLAVEATAFANVYRSAILRLIIFAFA